MSILPEEFSEEKEEAQPKKFSEREIEEAANFVTILTPFLGSGFEHIAVLEHTLEKWEEQKSTIVSAAAIIGPGYEKKEKELEYRIEHLEALINLLKAYRKSQDTIQEISEMDEGRVKINKMFGLD